MAYQSEAALEQQFIDQLNQQEYTTLSIPDYDALVANFKVQFEAFNAAKLNTPLTEYSAQDEHPWPARLSSCVVQIEHLRR